MKPMKNSYIYQNDMIYEFMNGDIIRIIDKLYLNQALYPIILQENDKVYKRLDYFQLRRAMLDQYQYEQYRKQTPQQYDAIQIDGDSNTYILKSQYDITPIKDRQEITIIGRARVLLYDNSRNGEGQYYDFTVNTQSGLSPQIYKDLIAMDISAQIPWITNVYWLGDEMGNVDYYAIIVDCQTYSHSTIFANPRITDVVAGSTPEQQLVGKRFRTAMLNDNFEVYGDMSRIYIEVLQNQEPTPLNKCYQIVYQDLNRTDIPETQTCSDLMKLIHDNQETLNYYIYNEMTNTIPSKDRYNRQVYISKYYSHIFISKKHENLFIKPDQLNKKMCDIQGEIEGLAHIIPHIEATKNASINEKHNLPTTIQYVKSQQDLMRINKMYLYNDIVPYQTSNKLYVNGMLYKVKDDDSITQFLSQFKKSVISVDYHFHEYLYAKGVYNENYMKIDFNKCYSHSLDNEELPTIRQIKSVQVYQWGQPIKNQQYYIIQDIQHPLIPCNILTGKNIKNLQMYLKVDLTKYIISEVIVQNHYANPFKYSPEMDKKTINIGIGCMYRNNESVYYNISPCDRIQVDNNVRQNYQFLHCQIINNKISLMLYALRQMHICWEDILEIHTDSMVVPKNNMWQELRYADNMKMFKQEEYNMDKYVTQQYLPLYPDDKYSLNCQLIQAFAGSGKTYYIQQQLEQFRKDRLYMDDKCLVLVCKNTNIEQYKQYRDLATIQSYQGILFQNNYAQVLDFNRIYLDEVYLMDSKFVKQLHSFLLANRYLGQVVYVGDMYQQCNMNCEISEYSFLQKIKNKALLSKNWRNDIDYQQFIVDGQFNYDLLNKYCIDNNLYFNPDEITRDNLQKDTVYICKSNDTMCKICTMYNMMEDFNNRMLINISSKDPNPTIVVKHNGYIIQDSCGKTMTSWYGNAITAYKSQGMQYKKILIDNTIKSVSQLYVAISRIKK